MHSENEEIENYYRPKDIVALEKIITNHRKKLNYIAGATDIMVQNENWLQLKNLVDLGNVTELSSTLEINESHALIGSALPICRIIHNETLQKKLPILVEACSQIGSTQIQNRATLGGNIANASPAGDTMPVLSVLDAQIWIGPACENKFSKLKIDEVMLGPGKNGLSNNRYIAFIFIPFPQKTNQFWYFRKVGQRKALAISKVSLAILAWKKENKIEEIRISTGSVSPKIVRSTITENILKNKELTEETIELARQSIMQEIAPISDIRSTEEYRRFVCGELLREALYLFLHRD